jgi:ABC-2 type transport system ATP-binding protein
MIKFENVSKKYGTKTALDNLSLEISAGEFFTLIGPNGAGKTTTVKLMVGLLRPTGGRILINGTPLDRDPLKAKRILAYIPDQPFIYDKLSGREFTRFISQLYHVKPDDYQKSFDKYVDIFQMSSYIDQLIETYSLGMKQRLVISATLLHRPRVIVVDEPLVGLDPQGARIVKNLLRNEAKNNGTTIFMSTHLLSIAEELAGRIGVINHGQLITIGTLADLQKRSQSDGKLEDVFLTIIKESC